MSADVVSTDRADSTGAVLRRYLDALVGGDIATIADSFAENATWSMHGDLPVSGTHHGRESIMSFLIGAGSLFVAGTQRFELGDPLVDGEHAVLEWRVTGTGAATGLPYDNRYAGIFVVRDGRIVEVREYLDTRHAASVLFAVG